MIQGRWPLSWWERLGHQITGWRRFPVPDGDEVSMPRPAPERWSTLHEVDWGVMADQSITEGRLDRITSTGRIRGYPIQRAALNRPFRTLTWGRADRGEHNVTHIPRPADRYWVTADPTPSWDIRFVITDGVSVWEGIQFDQDAPASRRPPLPNQAYSFRRSVDGEHVEGREPTTGYVASVRCWTFRSRYEAHEQALILADYVGADGLLETGPPCDGLYVLDRDSGSYRRMAALGGECAARAEHLATYGARAVDRSGYSDVRNNATDIGRRPHDPHLLTQAGAQWGRTNLHRFEVALKDLRLAI